VVGRPEGPPPSWGPGAGVRWLSICWGYSCFGGAGPWSGKLVPAIAPCAGGALPKAGVPSRKPFRASAGLSQAGDVRKLAAPDHRHRGQSRITRRC